MQLYMRSELSIEIDALQVLVHGTFAMSGPVFDNGTRWYLRRDGVCRCKKETTQNWIYGSCDDVDLRVSRFRFESFAFPHDEVLGVI